MKSIKKFLHRKERGDRANKTSDDSPSGLHSDVPVSAGNIEHHGTSDPSNPNKIDTNTLDDDPSRHHSRSHSDMPVSVARASGGVAYTDVSGPSNARLIGTSNMNAPNVEMSRSGFFANAERTDARYGTFNENININYGSDSSDVAKVLDRLKPVDRSAYDVPHCMEGTRKYVFEEVDRWLDSVDEPNILWLSGGPGAGKSSIASSMVHNLLERRRLGSRFFFRRGDTALGNPAAVWRTVAYDLTQHDPDFSNTMVEVLKARQDVLQGSDIVSHFKFLIEEPLRKHYEHSVPPVIVVDALDECDSDPSQAPHRNTFLDTLLRWSHLPRVFKLIVTGRDDRMSDALRGVCKQIILPTGGDVSADASKDIRQFFEKRFSKLVGASFPQWPGERILADLTKRAAGLFIWAETIMRLLEQGIPDEQQLESILRGNYGDGDDFTGLYRQVLFSSFPSAKGRTLEAYKVVVSAIVLARTPLHHDELPQFLSQPKLSVQYILRQLSSVLSIGDTVRIGHLSFTEFLCDPQRCPPEFFIDWQSASQDVAMICFKTMKEGLKFNICDLETSYLLNDEVKDLDGQIKRKISNSLSYSCRFWATHLQDATDTRDGQDLLLGQVEDFFYSRLLFWLEVMSLLKDIVVANAQVVTSMRWIERLDTRLCLFARDASRFIVNFDILILHSVPHIYLSALPFSPSNSLIAQHYRPQFPNTLCVAVGSDKDWPAMVGHCRGHTGHVTSVAFSPDGRRVVSGSGDMTICIWDVETGQVSAGPFEGHTDWVLSVAFSPDGRKVVSGSGDMTVCIWDVETGQVSAGPFEGHTDWVLSVAFSPDGRKVVSGSDDMTICIWDVETGQVSAGPFEGHTGWVRSVTFSPDGRKVVSGSFDKTICIWDVETGQISAGPFEGHTNHVTSVAFSPDGRKVVSGSLDKTICIWDVETGQVSTGPFKGHTSTVSSVAFSPDGRKVVSGSLDKTICIWDVKTGQVSAGPFEGHTDHVISVAFSPDGKTVVSGSVDHNICIWDVETGKVSTGPFEGHTNHVTSVAFSPDGRKVVSGSFDKTIWIWDIEIGQISAGPFEGHTNWVLSVAFSPDGRKVVSGSHDKTICIWDVKTGQVSVGPFKGHTDWVTSVAFSPDGRKVVSGSRDKTICIWDVETGQVSAGPFEGHTDWVFSVAFSPDGRKVVSGSGDKTVCIWDVETGQVSIGPFEGHTDWVRSVTFSPDGRKVVSGSDDKTICIWDVEMRQVSIGPFEGHTDWVLSVAFSPDGRKVVSGSGDKTICIWDVETGQVSAGPFVGHTHRVTSVAFSPDGKKVVSGSLDKIIRLWDVQTRQLTTHLPQPSLITSSDFISSGWLMRPHHGVHQRLFWIPHKFHSGLWNSETLLIIGARSVKLDLHKFVHGKDWKQCYFPLPMVIHSEPSTH